MGKKKSSSQLNGNGTKHAGGRPTDYKSDMPERAYKLCLLGLKNEDLAVAFGVTAVTLNNWMHSHPKFFDAIKKGKDEADAEIASSLYHRAKGYSHPDLHISVYKDKTSGEVDVVQTPMIKHYPPDTGACIFWLKNRQRHLWRDIFRQEHTGADGKPIEHHHHEIDEADLAQLSDEELTMAEHIGLLKRNGKHGKSKTTIQ